MPRNAETLTERFIVNPILYLTAPYRGEEADKISRIIRRPLEAEIVTRIIALCIPIFALIDTLINFSQGIYKYCVNRSSLIYSPYEIRTHFKRAAHGVAALFAGPLIGLISPKRLGNWYEKKDFPQFNPGHSNPHLTTCAMLRLLQAIPNNAGSNYTPAVETFKSFWKTSTLTNKFTILQFLNDHSNNSLYFREAAKKSIYQPVSPADSPDHKEVQWFNRDEILKVAGESTVYENMPSIMESFYYHPIPTEKDLIATLQSGRVKVDHQKDYQAALVSTQPEPCFGKYQLVFNRSIEFLSPLEMGFFFQDNKTYWAGFSQPIPVRADTLVGVFIDTGGKPEASAQQEVDVLQGELLRSTGRNIKVLSLEHKLVKAALTHIAELNMGIPIEWPATQTREGHQILIQKIQALPHRYVHPMIRKIADEVHKSQREKLV